MKSAAPTVLPEIARSTLKRAMRVGPPLAALAYPALIWAGSTVAPAFLVLALAVPVLGLVSAYQSGRSGHFPLTRKVAHTVFAAPALFTLLGVLLDFQTAIPLSSVGVWLALWSGLAIATFRERPRPLSSLSAPNGKLSYVHGISAVPIALFGLVHLLNHLGAVWSGKLHIAMMSAARVVYRNPVVETLLLSCLAFQLASGLLLVSRKLRQTAGWFDTVQSVSGLYLAVFLLSHTTAVFSTRYLRHIDTNWNWLTSSSIITDPWGARLGPYYFLAVNAFAAHGAGGVRKALLGHNQTKNIANKIFYATVSLGTLSVVLILAALIRG